MIIQARKQHTQLYEEALSRHAQDVRWYSSIPCYCVDDLSRPNPQHKECRGRGFLYLPMKEERVQEDVISLGGNIITLKNNIKQINRIMRGPIDIDYDSFVGNTITLKTSLDKAVYLIVDYSKDLERVFTGLAVYEGNNIVKANITTVDSKEGKFTGEITEVMVLTNITKNTPIKVLDFWEDRVAIDGIPDEGDILQITCKYLIPFKFIINNLTQKEKDQIAIFQEADASLTFPGLLSIGKGDLIMLLRAEQKSHAVGIYPGSGNYLLPFFHVSSIISIIDTIGELTNYTLVKNREIQFNDRKPNGKFSMIFNYNPTFTIWSEASALRYAENKAFVKRVPLKRYEMTSRLNKKPSMTPKGFDDDSGEF